MTKKWLWLISGAVAVGAFVAGVVVAQEGLKYPCLPAEYSDVASLTVAECRAIGSMARENCTGRLTGRLIKNRIELWLLPDGINLIVDTETQPSWNVYLGNGRFSCSDREVRAAYAEAAKEVMKRVRSSLPVADGNAAIEFFMKGATVGTWADGAMALDGEE